MERESGALTAVARTRLHGVVSYEPSTAVKYKCTYILYTCMYMAEYKEVHCNFITIYWPKDMAWYAIYTLPAVSSALHSTIPYCQIPSM